MVSRLVPPRWPGRVNRCAAQRKGNGAGCGVWGAACAEPMRHVRRVRHPWDAHHVRGCLRCTRHAEAP